MTEDEAQRWLATRFGEDGLGRLRAFVGLLKDEMPRQNLIARSSVESLWFRHVLDSAQLVDLAPDTATPWLDIGTGAGFPGLVIACLRAAPMILVEPRARRADFLRRTVAELGLDWVEVQAIRVERSSTLAGVMSARAVAGIAELFTAGIQCSTRDTIWLLPRGRGAREEIQRAQRDWRGVFHVKQSMTETDAEIVIASKVAPR